jgi:hypothetical protein
VLTSNRGIVKKSLKDTESGGGSGGNVKNNEEYYIINFRLNIENNQEHMNIVKRWHAFFMRCVEILYDSQMIPSIRAFSKEEFMNKHTIVFKDPTYVSTYIDPNIINTDSYKQYGSGMYLRLIYDERYGSRFYGLDGNEIEWRFLMNSIITAVPVINVRGISIINNIPHLVVRLRSATLIEPPKPQRTSQFQPELVQDYITKDNIENFRKEMEKLKLSDQQDQQDQQDNMLDIEMPMSDDNIGIRSLLTSPPKK